MNTTTRHRVGLGLTGAVTVFLLADATMHIANVEVVRTSMADLGYREGLAPALGVIELGCIALYLWRRTELLGAVLLSDRFEPPSRRATRQYGDVSRLPRYRSMGWAVLPQPASPHDCPRRDATRTSCR
jgi:DoxX-like family